MTVRIGETIISGSEVASSVRDTNHVATPIYNWTGTLNEYNALGTYNPNWLYYITDDITSEGIAPSPTGSVTAFAGTSIPNGWLLCNGGAISRSTYSLLFAAIGTTYGEGDGSTTFNLPNLSGYKVPLGVINDIDRGMNTTGGLPNITGNFYSYDWAIMANAFVDGCFSKTNGSVYTAASTNKTNQAYKLTMNATNSSSIYGTLQDTSRVVPTGVSMYYIIKY